MIRQADSVLQECLELCEQCRSRCEALAHSEGELAALGSVMVTCTAMSRICADMLSHTSSMSADLAVLRMSARTLCGLAAHLMSACAEACTRTHDRELHEVGALLTRCAGLCTQLAVPRPRSPLEDRPSLGVACPAVGGRGRNGAGTVRGTTAYRAVRAGAGEPS